MRDAYPINSLRRRILAVVVAAITLRAVLIYDRGEVFTQWFWGYLVAVFRFCIGRRISRLFVSRYIEEYVTDSGMFHLCLASV